MKIFLSGLLLTFLLPFSVFANGGDQRVLGSEFLINLSKSPFTPVAGTKTAMTVSFVDLKTRAPIKEDILVYMRVTKGRGSMVPIFEQKDILVKGGVFDISYTFENSGLHEVFFDFAYASKPEQIYEPPDFLIDVQGPRSSPLLVDYVIAFVSGGLVSVVVYWVTTVRKREVAERTSQNPS